MRNAADGDVPALPKHRNEKFGSMISELASLLDHVQASIKAIDTAVALDASSACLECVDNVVVLDDVAARHAKARAALNACNISLDAALQFLRNAETPAPPTKFAPKLIRLSGRG